MPDPGSDLGVPRPLPDFVGLGALKAGTSYLDAMLRTHPGLSMPLHVKEVDYFTSYVERGASWYESQFAPYDGRPRGEVSPQYLFDPACPARIAAANPGARLLVNVRHPVARTFSQYRHWVQETGYAGDFETFLAEHPGAVERSRYWTLIERYRAVFPDRQILVVVFEDLVADPARELPRVYDFLGVSPDHAPRAVGDAVNVSSVPRFPRLYARGKRVAGWLYAHDAARVVARVKSTRLHRALLGQGSTRPAGELQPPPRITEELGRQLRAEAGELSRYVGRDLVEMWRL